MVGIFLEIELVCGNACLMACVIQFLGRNKYIYFIKMGQVQIISFQYTLTSIIVYQWNATVVYTNSINCKTFRMKDRTLRATSHRFNKSLPWSWLDFFYWVQSFVHVENWNRCTKIVHTRLWLSSRLLVSRSDVLSHAHE